MNGTNPVGTGGFFTKLNADATAAIYSTYLGGTGLALAVDGSGDALIAGDTTYGFITSKNAFQTTTASIYPTAIFALKLAIGKGTPAETGTAVTLTSTSSTFLSNRPSTFIATVKPTALTAIPTGAVRFDSEAGSATIPLDGSGVATYTTSALPLGFDIVLATYTGSSSYDPSNANLEAYVTTNDTLNVTVTPNTLVAGQAANFLAAVTSSGTKAVATGTVSFQFGSGSPVVVPLNASGQASYTMTAPPTQTLAYLSVTVSYSGDSNFDPISGTVFYYQELPPALSLLSGGNQKVLYGNRFPAPIVLQALGLNNVPLTGTTINFSGVGLSFNPANTVTDGNGRAQTFVNPTAAGYLTASATVANSGSVIGIPLLSGEVNLKVSSPRTTVFYGNPIPALGYYFEGFVNGDTAASAVTGTPIVTTNATAQSPAGTYKIFVNLGTLAARGYNFGLATSLLDIHTAPLQLTASSFTIHKGDPIPTLTYTLSGFVYGQDASVVSGAPVLTTTATNSSSPGRYAIHIRHGSLTAQNYAFVDVPGVLTILP